MNESVRSIRKAWGMPATRRDGPLSGLGEEEVELLALLAEGRNDEKIGEQLGLDLDEVLDAAGRLYAKLGLRGSPDELRRIVSVLEVLPPDSCGRGVTAAC